jgi:LytS/YehU family sensor histidine kinase
LPIILIAHALLYYHNSQQKELRATELSGQLARARLQVLKNQLQPHFLFNTLHSISGLMLTNVAAADRMMTFLSDLLRMSLEDKGDQLTTLNRDLEFLGAYVEIEKARFEDKLRVNFDIEPECLDAQVPHMLLQPLVENAVRHGTSRRSQPGEIDVIAKHRNRNLEIRILDNGPGFVGSAEDVFSKGLGLSVTRERLKVLYGNAQDCKIRNAETGGAEVSVLLPFRLAPKPEQTDKEHEYQ